MNTPMTIHIKAAGYENIYLDCGHCGYENVFNRATELGLMPISGKEVKCQNCAQPVWINSDTIQMATYHWFLQELPMLKQKKLYRDYALTLCQGAENFFLQAVMNKKFDREPKYADENNGLQVLEYQADSREYMKSIERKTFRGMRVIFLDIFKDEREHPSPRISQLKEDRREWAFGVVERSEIDVLRNKVVHKQAHRPTLQEVEQHDDLIEALHWLGEYLGVWDSHFAHSQFLLDRNAN